MPRMASHVRVKARCRVRLPSGKIAVLKREAVARSLGEAHDKIKGSMFDELVAREGAPLGYEATVARDDAPPPARTGSAAA